MRERNIAVAIILTIVTCGIYGIYWFIVLTDDARLQVEINKHHQEELLSY